MVKNKKSKILAMALCASVMTGIYASPVMAAAIEVFGSSTLEIEGGTEYTITSGTLNLDGAGIASALNDENIVANSITVNKINGIDVVSKGTALTIGKVTLDKGHINASSALFNSDDGKVRIKNGDVVTLDSNGTTEKYSLNTIGANTAGIRREGDENSGGHRTIIEEQLVVNRDTGVISNIGGSFTVDRSGNLVASTLGNRSGTFGVDESGNLTAGLVNGVNVQTVSNDVGVLRTDVNTLRTDADTLRTDVNSNSQNISTLQGNVSTNTNDIGVLRTDVNTLRGDTDTLRTDVNGLNTTVTGNVTDISELQQKTEHITHDKNGTHIEGMTVQKGEINGQEVANVSGIYSINGASFEATGQNGGIRISGVTLEAGGINAYAESYVGGVTFDGYGAMTGVTAIDGAAVSGSMVR